MFTFTCNTFKTDTNRTKFLGAIKNPLHRSAINKSHLGNHQLRIETGRYTVPNTREHLTFCSLCQANEVEKECHVMFLALCVICFATNFLMKSLKNITF